MNSRISRTAGMIVVLLAVTAGIIIGSDAAVADTRSGSVPGLLKGHESGEREFREVVVDDKIVYYHQRMIGDAVVEKDFIVYQFDSRTSDLLAKKSHWRDDLPEELPSELIPRDQAESMVEGEVLLSHLYYISPESDVYPIEPTPENPCWIIRSVNEYGHLIVTVVDAVSGRLLGNGIPPPYTGFSMSGPCYYEPCDLAWISWYQNAEYWFEVMGYNTEAVLWPTHAEIQGHISSDQTSVFYEIAHSGEIPTRFASGCIDGQFREYTYWYDIEAWIADYPKMPFAFLASCFSMCDTSYGNLSHAFRKGSTEGTVTIGYCGMSNEDCWTCWDYSLDWQETLFTHMSQGWSAKAAFDQANADYPACLFPDCILFAGDDDLSIIPRLRRDGSIAYDCGDVDNSGMIDIDDISYLLVYYFGGGPPPVPYECVGNVDGSVGGMPIDIDDVVYLIKYVFEGGPAPVYYCCELEASK